MKTWKKILLTFGLLVLFMAILPLLAVKFLVGWDAMAIGVIGFFAVYPLLAVGLGILAGTEMRKLWWIPFAAAAVFPPLFGIAIQDFVWDLYFYSVFYLPLGLIAMVIAHFVKKKTLKK